MLGSRGVWITFKVTYFIIIIIWGVRWDAVLGLCCYMQTFSSFGKQGLLTAVASLVMEHSL